jgi:hypothetical protein
MASELSPIEQAKRTVRAVLVVSMTIGNARLTVA